VRGQPLVSFASPRGLCGWWASTSAGLSPARRRQRIGTARSTPAEVGHRGILATVIGGGFLHDLMGKLFRSEWISCSLVAPHGVLRVSGPSVRRRLY